MTSVQSEDGTDMKEDDDSEDEDEYDKEKLKHKPLVRMNPEWAKIYAAVQSVPCDESVVKLKHPAKNIYVIKRREDGQVVTRFFEDGCNQLAENLRLRGAMFNHHMPWSYKGLFDGYGLNVESTPVEDVNSVLRLE